MLYHTRNIKVHHLYKVVYFFISCIYCSLNSLYSLIITWGEEIDVCFMTLIVYSFLAIEQFSCIINIRKNQINTLA